MIIIYVLLILLAAFPLVLTIRRMCRNKLIKRKGIRTNGRVTCIHTFRVKSSQIDNLTIQYQDRATGHFHIAKASTQANKYKVGDFIEIAYLPVQHSKYAITETKGGYTFILVFCIILFLFVLFAVYKINEMV